MEVKPKPLLVSAKTERPLRVMFDMGLSDGDVVYRRVEPQPAIPAREKLNAGGRILRRAAYGFLRHEVPTAAAAITFYALLSFFPAVGAFVSLYGLIANVHTASEHLSYLSGVLPAEALRFVGDEMVRAALTRPSQLSLAFMLSLLFSIWSANAAVQALINGLNVVYVEREKRHIVAYYLLSLTMTVCALLAFLVAVTAIVVLPAIQIPGGIAGTAISNIFRWATLWAANVAALAAIYRYGPNRKEGERRCVLPGAVAASTAWLIVSLGFSMYVSHFANYDQTYGSLGAAVGFMMWIWLGVLILLFGAEINAEMEVDCD